MSRFGCGSQLALGILTSSLSCAYLGGGKLEVLQTAAASVQEKGEAVACDHDKLRKPNAALWWGVGGASSHLLGLSKQISCDEVQYSWTSI